MDIQEPELEVTDWIDLAQDKVADACERGNKHFKHITNTCTIYLILNFI
jgi:hypothetical protein